MQPNKRAGERIRIRGTRRRSCRIGSLAVLLLLFAAPPTIQWQLVADALTPSSSSSRKVKTHKFRDAPEALKVTFSSEQEANVFTLRSDIYESLDTLSPSEIERMIVRAGRRGRTDEALAIYECLQYPAIRQINAAIDACARARPVRLSKAFDLLAKSPVQPNVYTFGALMNACARAGDVQRAQTLLRDMPVKYNVRPNAVVYHAAVSACDRTQPPRPDVAWRLLEEAREKDGLALSVVGYNAALSAAARAGDCKKAVELLTRMETAASEKNPNSLIPEPDAVTYGTLLSAFERAEDWNSLMKYATKMQEAGHRLDGLAITSILHACSQLGLVKEAVHYFHLMKEVGPYRRQTAGYEIAGHRAPLEGPDSVAFLLAITACARGGDFQQGLNLLDEYVVTGGPDDVAVFTAAVRCCESAGEYRTAFSLVERMRQLKVQPNELTFAAVLGACATACAKMHENQAETRQALLHKALRLLRVLHKDPTTVDPNITLYNAAIRVCAEAHDVGLAFQLVDELAQLAGLKANIVTYGTLMSACERAGSLDHVNHVFLRMREDEIEANEVVYGAAISCCRKAGAAERALLLLRKMIRDGLRPNIVTFNTVLMAQVEAKGRGPKELERAMIVFQLLSSEKYSSATPNRQTYNLMVRFLAECQRPREAEVLIRKMRQEDNFIPDVNLYTAVVAAFERNGQPLKALRLMESMNADGYDFYEAKVLNAAFKRALKVANVMGRGFSGVHDDDDDDDDDDDEGKGGDDSNTDGNVGTMKGNNFASRLQSQVESERFVQGKRFPVDDDDGLPMAH